jgi:hypothetical protein
MPSYQDIDSRLGVLERKLEFVMDTFKVTREERSIIDPTQVFRHSMTLNQVYREISTGMAEIVKDTDNGTASDNS